ncbi:MAG: CdaR family protein [Desulfarculaceae bacterium]
MLKWVTHNWSLKLLALCLAVALWLFVVGQEKAEISLKVPIEYTNIPRGTLVVGDVVGEVDVRLSGSRSLIRRVASQRLNQTVNLGGLDPGAHEVQVSLDELNLPPGVRVARVSPPRFTVTLARRANRTVVVRPVIKGEPAPGLKVAGVTFIPEKVKISGSQEDLFDLDWIWTVPIDVEGLSKTTTLPVQLRLPRGRTLRLETSKVTAEVKIEPKEGGGLPPESDAASPELEKGKKGKSP